MSQELVLSIKRWKKERNAYILAHNYQPPEIQDIADYCGDSLGMAQNAAKLDNPVLLVCGVYFMAETAAILNPDKTVLVPDMQAGCPLANFATAAAVQEWRNRYPEHTFVAYVNSSAEVKALVDVCCTSSNAVKIVRELKNDKIVFLPDKNLGSYVKKMVPEKEVVLWPGFCVVHETVDIEGVLEAKAAHPAARVLMHPECPESSLELADAVLSTGQMMDYVGQNPQQKEFIIVTEWGMTYALSRRYPGVNFYEPSRRLECRNMKKNTLAKVETALREMPGNLRVTVDPVTAGKARGAIEKMLVL